MTPRQWKRAHGKPRKTPSRPIYVRVPEPRYQITPDGRVERVFHPEMDWQRLSAPAGVQAFMRWRDPDSCIGELPQ